MHALGQATNSLERDTRAAGVMMIPIPRAGVLKGVDGIEQAREVVDIEEIIITAHIGQELRPPPEGAAYLGFIFSRSADSAAAETALRQAHSLLEIDIDSEDDGQVPVRET